MAEDVHSVRAAARAAGHAPTLRPGHWLNHAAKHCECCAATPAAAPLGPRKTIGQLIWPADMNSVCRSGVWEAGIA